MGILPRVDRSICYLYGTVSVSGLMRLRAYNRLCVYSVQGRLI